MSLTRWWFQICFMFTPTWGDDPIWLISSKGWHHQLVYHWKSLRPEAMLRLLDKKKRFSFNFKPFNGTWYLVLCGGSVFNISTYMHTMLKSIHAEQQSDLKNSFAVIIPSWRSISKWMEIVIFVKPWGWGRSRCWCWRRSSQGQLCLVGFGWLDLHEDFLNDKLRNHEDLWLFDYGGRIVVSSYEQLITLH